MRSVAGQSRTDVGQAVIVSVRVVKTVDVVDPTGAPDRVCCEVVPEERLGLPVTRELEEVVGSPETDPVV